MRNVTDVPDFSPPEPKHKANISASSALPIVSEHNQSKSFQVKQIEVLEVINQKALRTCILPIFPHFQLPLKPNHNLSIFHSFGNSGGDCRGNSEKDFLTQHVRMGDFMSLHSLSKIMSLFWHCWFPEVMFNCFAEGVVWPVSN
jgi:hypothetical protein